jgi:hypothetical protein
LTKTSDRDDIQRMFDEFEAYALDAWAVLGRKLL